MRGCLALVLVALCGCATGSRSAAPGGDAAPLSFKLPRYPQRDLFDLASTRGKVVVLDVWATWCEPCREALPMYEALVKQYGPKGFVVLAINVDADPAPIPAFIKETHLDLPVLLDPDAAFAEPTLGVKRMPTSFVLDRRGVIRHTHEGFSEDFLALYQAEIEELLAEP